MRFGIGTSEAFDNGDDGIRRCLPQQLQQAAVVLCHAPQFGHLHMPGRLIGALLATADTNGAVWFGAIALVDTIVYVYN